MANTNAAQKCKKWKKDVLNAAGEYEPLEAKMGAPQPYDRGSKRRGDEDQGPVEEIRNAGWQWALDMESWCRRVRRDILLLEHYMITKKVAPKDAFYGDPGDPPPPPTSF